MPARTVPLQKRWRRFRMGLSTLLGRPKGYFIPYRHADIPVSRAPYAGIAAIFQHAEPQFRQRLAALDRHADAMLAIGATEIDSPPPEPRWHQGWFTGLDAAMAYTLVRDTAPTRIIEVGSGHSTRFLARAVRDGRLNTRIVAIDPQPRADLLTLPVTAHRTPVQLVGESVFAGLTAGDMLFIDSSHIAMPGTDVDWLVGRVLPRLPAGVRVHIHDIFLPDPYPEAWAWRGYNEHQVVAALLAGGGFKPIWSSVYARRYLAQDFTGSVVDRLPLIGGALETSLWVEKTVPAAASAPV